MTILTELSVPAAFIIFFLTLGPLKAIGPFAQATLYGIIDLSIGTVLLPLMKGRCRSGQRKQENL